MINQYFLPVLMSLVLLGWSGLPATAQKDTTRLNQEVEVVKAYRPSVSGAARINLLPEISDTTQFRPELRYSITSHPVREGFRPSSLTATNLLRGNIQVPGFARIEGGYGTSQSPFFNLWLSNPNSTNGSLGLLFNHLSSQGMIRLKGGHKVDAPFSYNRALVFGSYVMKGVTLATEFCYTRDLNRFYGYPAAIPAGLMTSSFAKYFNTDQVDQAGWFKVEAGSNASAISDLKFNTGLHLGYFSTSTSQVEKTINLKGNFAYSYGNVIGKLNSSFEHLETTNVTSVPALAILNSPKSTWINLNPAVAIQGDYVVFEGGVNLWAVFDKTNGNKLKPYPRASITIKPASGSLAFYAGIDGTLRNNTLSGIAQENRYVNPGLEVSPTDIKVIYSGGVRGRIAGPMAFSLGAKYSMADDQYFYITKVVNYSGKAAPELSDLTYNNAFEVTYGNLSKLDISGELTYQTPAVLFQFSGHYFSYQSDQLQKPPYMPDFTLGTSAEFRLTNQFSALADATIIGPRSIMLDYYVSPVSSLAPPPPVFLAVDPVAEVNAGVRYAFRKGIAFTGRVENLLNRKDEPWFGYTVQGIRLKLGFSFTF